jgi:hypothetical protein
MHEALYEVIERRRIIVHYAVLADTVDKLLGFCYYHTKLDRPVVILDENLRGRTAEHDVVLAHEVGHIVTSPRLSPLEVHAYCARIVIGQDELRATRWACDCLMPEPKSTRLSREVAMRVWELAEYFCVTDWLVRQKWAQLKARARPLGLTSLVALQAAGV